MQKILGAFKLGSLMVACGLFGAAFMASMLGAPNEYIAYPIAGFCVLLPVALLH